MLSLPPGCRDEDCSFCLSTLTDRVSETESNDPFLPELFAQIYFFLSATILMNMGGYLGVYVILFRFFSMLKDHCGYTGKNE